MTRNEVITLALRRLGILASDRAASADQVDYCNDELTVAIAHLEGPHGLTIGSGDIADNIASGMSHLLAANVAPHYGVNPIKSEAAAIGMIRAALLPDDRVDSRDLDDDGSVSEAEADAAKRAEFY